MPVRLCCVCNVMPRFLAELGIQVTKPNLLVKKRLKPAKWGLIINIKDRVDQKIVKMAPNIKKKKMEFVVLGEATVGLISYIINYLNFRRQRRNALNVQLPLEA